MKYLKSINIDKSPSQMHDVHFPEAFEKRMRNALHKDWDAFAAAHMTQLTVSIRLNSAKNFANPKAEQIPWAHDGKYLEERPPFTLDPLFHSGCYYVQEASSMFLEQAVKQSVNLNEPLRVLDLCAAPGGKSTHLLSLISKESLLVSNEVIRTRASILAENIQKWGKPNVVVTNNDPEHFTDIPGFFDLIVVDAPCSGEGLFRKDHEAMKEWSPDHVVLCANRQKRILSHIWPSLKPNGILIYCTCTFNEMENEENLVWLSQQNEVEFLDLDTDPAWKIEKVKKENVTGYRFYPHKTKGEGFFISVIRKLGDGKVVRIKTSKKVFTPSSNILREQISSWISDTSGMSILQFRDILLLMPESQVAAIEFLSNHLHIVHAGTAMGVAKHEKIIPEHAAALSYLIKKDNFQCIDVNHDDALRYLRKENLERTELKRGFSLICYKDVPLGWVNVLDNRINNMYPSNWRIRMSS